MLIGLTFDLRSDYESLENVEAYPPDFLGEFDSQETIDQLQKTIIGLGYECVQIGNLFKLLVVLQGNQPKPDLIFNIAEGLHGRSREAHIPSILEAFNIPFTFSDTLTNAMCLDKGISKHMLLSCGLPTAPFKIVKKIDLITEDSLSDLSFPLFVKPIHEGTSKGINESSITNDTNSLLEAISHLIHTYKQPVLVEEFLPGREFTVGVLGTDLNARVLGIVEIILLDKSSRVYGYQTKEECESLVEYVALNRSIRNYSGVKQCWGEGRVGKSIDQSGEHGIAVFASR